MTEEIKDVNAKVDQLEAAKKKYASADTVISIGGYEFTPAKLMVAVTIVSTTLGGLYGCFEVYKDYMGMKKRIADYVAPDLSELNKKMEITMQNSEKSVQYTQDIKNDLKADIRRLEGVVEGVERDTKSALRDTDKSVQDARKDVREDLDKARGEVNAIRKEMADARREINREVETLKKEVDSKIQKAIDNPLANK